MQLTNVPPSAPHSQPPVTQKLPYAPPKATFVPLKLEERLLTCGSDNSVNGKTFGVCWFAALS